MQVTPQLSCLRKIVISWMVFRKPHTVNKPPLNLRLPTLLLTFTHALQSQHPFLSPPSRGSKLENKPPRLPAGMASYSCTCLQGMETRRLGRHTETRERVNRLNEWLNECWEYNCSSGHIPLRAGLYLARLCEYKSSSLDGYAILCKARYNSCTVSVCIQRLCGVLAVVSVHFKTTAVALTERIPPPSRIRVAIH